MIGAGNASASVYNCNPNLNTFGGNKKQDIATRVGINPWTNREYIRKANGQGKTKLFMMNQLSGVGVGKSMFNTRFTQPRGTAKSTNLILYLINNSLLREEITFDQFKYHVLYYSKQNGFKIVETDIVKFFNNLVTRFGANGKILKSNLSINKDMFIRVGGKCVGACGEDSCSGKCCAEISDVCAQWCEQGECNDW